MITVESTQAALSLTVPAPTGIAVGDMLILCVHRYGVGIISLPAGWSTITDNIDSDSKSRIHIGYKIADSSDVTATSYTSSTTGTSVILSFIYRISGTSSSVPQLFSSSVTPVTNTSLPIIIAFSGDNGGRSTTKSGYNVTTSGPSVTFTERVDFSNSDTARISLAVADGPYSTYTPITSYGVTFSGAVDGTGTNLILVAALEVPVVTTQATTDIGFDTATVNGTVVSDEGFLITQRGVVYSTTPTPTTSSSKVIVSGTTGAFAGVITGLNSNTTYYARPYAINSKGTTYGDEISFTTSNIPDNIAYKNINATSGSTYAVRAYIGGTTGTVTIQLGSTGASQTFAAGAGYVTLQGDYSGLNGLIFSYSVSFDGYIDDVSYVQVIGDTPIDWSLSTLTSVLPINSSVTFQRIDDKDFNRFILYRYLDIQFKDQDAYVTVMLKKEANEEATTTTKEFLVSNTSDEVLPFINKRLSMLTRNQSIRLTLSNNNLNETFTVCQFVITGSKMPRRTFKSDDIISI